MTFTTAEFPTKVDQRLTLSVSIINPDGVRKDITHPLEEGFTQIESTFYYQSPNQLSSPARLASLKIWLPTGYCSHYMFVGRNVCDDTIEFLNSTVGLITHAFVERQSGNVDIAHPGIKTLTEVTPPQIQGE